MRCAWALVWVAWSCTDGGYVGRLHGPEQAAAGATATAAAGQSSFGASCSLPPCTILPCDPSDPLCLWCGSDADCADEKVRHVCEVRTGVCLECLEAKHCPERAPICHFGECVSCNDDDDCGDGWQCEDGHCVPD
ncbi:MAG TPA: hypothetical protein VJR89_34315 [Polyangiales bacterium]|nr:hypothetical protein [Polyangiales bacterium]